MGNLWDNLLKVRAQAPLIHNITNYVVMNTTANALLAVGASPVMAHAIDEVEVMVGYAKALVLNIGTLSPPWVQAMLRAGRVARARSIPIVLDPVGAGATPLRTDVALELLSEVAPTVVRGNASEIRALAESGGFTKGVDSVDSVDSALEAARSLVDRYGLVVSISGPTDVVVSSEGIARVHNGHPMMTRVTGMGCTATALTGVLLAVESSAEQAATQAMLLAGIVGEMAAERSSGPGSFQVNFLDVLYSLTPSDIDHRAKWDSG
jgi:hydroxyethylthiazole kinase